MSERRQLISLAYRLLGSLTDRPGRVDPAVRIPRPDADGRERLLRLHTRGVRLDLPDPEPVLTATEGVTASFIRELARCAVNAELDAGARGEVRLDLPILSAALEELLDERNALTSAILGGPRSATDPDPDRDPAEQSTALPGPGSRRVRATKLWR